MLGLHDSLEVQNILSREKLRYQVILIEKLGLVLPLAWNSVLLCLPLVVSLYDISRSLRRVGIRIFFEEGADLDRSSGSSILPGRQEGVMRFDFSDIIQWNFSFLPTSTFDMPWINPRRFISLHEFKLYCQYFTKGDTTSSSLSPLPGIYKQLSNSRNF